MTNGFSTAQLLSQVREGMDEEEKERSKSWEKTARSSGMQTSELVSQIPISEEERRGAPGKPMRKISSFERALEAASAVPAVGIVAGAPRAAMAAPRVVAPYVRRATEFFSRGGGKVAKEAPSAAPELDFASPLVRRAEELFVPKTTKEALKGVGGAATVGAAGGEFQKSQQRDIERFSKEQFPDDPEAQRRLQNRLIEGLGLGFDVAFAGGTQALGRKIRGIAEPNIPVERAQAAEFMRERGAPATTAQVLRGKEAKVREGRLGAQQDVANKVYNESVGLPPSNKFGTEEFKKARDQIDTDYKKILTGKTVKLDKQFFDDFSKLFEEQMQLRQSGLVFSETRPILETLRSISNLPANLRSRIDSLADVPQETTDPQVIGESLRLIRESLPVVRAQQAAGDITIGAEEYNRLRSMLGDSAYRTTDKDRARLLKNMQRSFDGAADRSLPEEASNLFDVRRRFEALKTLEQAQLGAEPGVIPANRVGRVIEQVYDEGSIYGIPNRLAGIGRAGVSLGMVEPGSGARIEGVKDVIGGIRFPLDALRARLATTKPSPGGREREVARSAAAIIGAQGATD